MTIANSQLIEKLILLKTERRLLKEILLSENTGNKEEIKKNLLEKKKKHDEAAFYVFHNINSNNPYFDVSNELVNERSNNVWINKYW